MFVICLCVYVFYGICIHLSISCTGRVISKEIRMHEESQEKMTSENYEEMEREERLEKEETEEEKAESDLLYTLEEVPPWYMSIFFGFQVS